MHILKVIPPESSLHHYWQSFSNYHNLAHLEQLLYTTLYSTLTTQPISELTVHYLIHFNQFIKDRLEQITNELLMLTTSFEQSHTAHLCEISKAHLFKLLHDELPLALHIEFTDIKKYMLFNLECYLLALFGAVCIVNIEVRFNAYWHRQGASKLQEFQLEDLRSIYKQLVSFYSCKQAIQTLKSRRSQKPYSLGQFMQDTEDELNNALENILHSPKPSIKPVSTHSTPALTPHPSMVLYSRQQSIKSEDQIVRNRRASLSRMSFVLPPI